MKAAPIATKRAPGAEGAPGAEARPKIGVRKDLVAGKRQGPAAASPIPTKKAPSLVASPIATKRAPSPLGFQTSSPIAARRAGKAGLAVSPIATKGKQSVVGQVAGQARVPLDTITIDDSN